MSHGSTILGSYYEELEKRESDLTEALLMVNTLEKLFRLQGEIIGLRNARETLKSLLEESDN